MSDGYDRTGQQEFEFSRVPDFNQMMSGMLAKGPGPTEAKPAPGGFDPYKAMLNKKAAEDGKPIDTSNTVKWPEQEVKALEDFCKQHGVLGFNCGKMSPSAALAMLKNMMGIADGPLESRVPPGYEKLGVKGANSPSYPYQQMLHKKSLLKG